MSVCAGSWNLSLRTVLLNREIDCGCTPCFSRFGAQQCDEVSEAVVAVLPVC